MANKSKTEEKDTCSICGCEYITRSSDWKRMCKCNSNPKLYDVLLDSFEKAFNEDDREIQEKI